MGHTVAYYDRAIGHSIQGEAEMINRRKLAAVDMARFGTRFIVAEYAVGVVLPLILGLLSIRSGRGVIWGFWLVAIAANYVPLLIYAILIAKGGTAKEEGLPEFVNAKKYAVQQVTILVPFLVVLVALVQEIRSRQNHK
jgi:hypothetical protein